MRTREEYISRLGDKIADELAALPKWLSDAIDDVNLDVIAARCKWIYDELIDQEGGEAEAVIKAARDYAKRASAEPEDEG